LKWRRVICVWYLPVISSTDQLVQTPAERVIFFSKMSYRFWFYKWCVPYTCLLLIW